VAIKEHHKILKSAELWFIFAAGESRLW